MSFSKIFLYFCISFLAGIFISSFFNPAIIAGLVILVVFVLGIFCFLFRRRGEGSFPRKPVIIFGACLIIFLLGNFRFQVANFFAENNAFLKYSNQKITILGIISNEPEINDNNAKLKIKVKYLNGIEIKGKVLVTVSKYNNFSYGDKLRITGILRVPPIFKDFNYRDYLKKEKIYVLMDEPDINLISKNCGNFIYNKILVLKNKLRENIEKNLSLNEEAILGAIMLGDQRKISYDLKEKLNKTGLRHITAVSGMHIAILTSLLMTFLIALGFWRGQAFYLTVLFIFFYILMIGIPASALRAAIMGFLFLLAQKIGRVSMSSRAVIFAAALMCFFNPFLLRFDIGFQLSFLAVLGIIYLSPIFESWFKKIPFFVKKLLSPIRGLLSMTLSAQIFTLPILIYNFGYFSPIGIVTNILIVPFLPYIMGLGFLFALMGIIYQPFGWLLSLPANILLIYTIKVINFFA